MESLSEEHVVQNHVGSQQKSQSKSNRGSVTKENKSRNSSVAKKSNTKEDHQIVTEDIDHEAHKDSRKSKISESVKKESALKSNHKST